MRPIHLLLALLAVPAIQLRAEPPVTIRPGDVFDIRLSGVPPDFQQEFNGLQYSVGPDGIVNLPYIGKMKVAGFSSSQFEDQLQAKYVAAKIFTHPIIIISVQQTAVQRSVTISGGVKGPGKQPWASDLTLGSAIGSAGGISDFGNPKGIKVVRDGKILGVFNYKDIQLDPSKDIKLVAGDQVIVKE